MDRLITARWVVPIAGPPVEDGAVLLEAGRIASVGRRADVLEELRRGDRAGGSDGSAEDRLERLDLGEAAVLPGFVNVHAHLELTALRGYLEEGDFFRWIRRLTSAKYSILAPDEVLTSALWGVLEATRAGVTTVGEVCDLGVSREALSVAGLRAVLFQEVFGPAEADAERSLEVLVDRLEDHRRFATPRMRVGISPHAPYTVSAKLLAEVAKLAVRNSLPMTIHAAESQAEKDLLEDGRGPFADNLRSRGISWHVPRCSTVRYLERLGALEPRPLLVHCVHATEEDVGLLARMGSRFAHCPRSNAKLGHGIAPLGRMLEAGVATGIGTDSVASNNVCDVLEEARLAALLLRAQGRGGLVPEAREVLRLATLAGAEALGLERTIGTIEEGKLADLTAIGLGAPHVQPVHDVEAALAWSASARDVILTMVEGEVLYRDGLPSRLDEEALRADLAAVVEKLRAASRRDG